MRLLHVVAMEMARAPDSGREKDGCITARMDA